MLLSVRNAL